MQKTFHLEIKPEYRDRFYIGNVLDILNNYFNLKAQVYLLGGSALSSADNATLVRENGARIRVYRREENEFVLEGLVDENFPDFCEKAQELLDEFFAR